MTGYIIAIIILSILLVGSMAVNDELTKENEKLKEEIKILEQLNYNTLILQELNKNKEYVMTEEQLEKVAEKIGKDMKDINEKANIRIVIGSDEIEEFIKKHKK